MTVTGLTGTEYQLLAKPFSSGGEGEIYRIAGDTEKRIAKIYHQDAVAPELEEKLKIMVKNHPGTQVKSQVAWPLDVVYNNNSFCGFIMPELDINTELGNIYRYPSELNISCQQKITIAKNICAVISAVHKAGYVFGDFNPRNIGVNSNTGLVAFLDTDTYHVTDTKSQKVYRCNVCAPGYAAPELLEKCADHVSSYPNDSKNTYSKAPLPTFTKETDNFALAIHIFKLLNNGYTPFGGIPETASASQASPGTGDAAVKRDSYCFKDGNKPQSVAIPPISVFPQELAKLFTRAFVIGRKDPEQRPSSLEWHDVLTKYEKTLVTCSKYSLHQYDPKNTDCPWCKADRQYQDSIRQIPDQEVYSSPISPVEPVSTVTAPSPSSQIKKKKNDNNNRNKSVSTSKKKSGGWIFPLLVIAVVIFFGYKYFFSQGVQGKYNSTVVTTSALNILNWPYNGQGKIVISIYENYPDEQRRAEARQRRKEALESGKSILDLAGQINIVKYEAVAKNASTTSLSSPFKLTTKDGTDWMGNGTYTVTISAGRSLDDSVSLEKTGVVFSNGSATIDYNNMTARH